jgi:polyvinyl alcohol dehydrogenase (cytochrome)
MNWRGLVLPAIAFALSHACFAQLPEEGATAQTFTESCATCHGNPAVKNAPDVATLRQMTPDSIYAALTTGLMRAQAQNLSDGVKVALTVFLAGRKPGTASIADAKALPNHCSATPMDLSSPMWNRWGVDLDNSRFQPAAAAGILPSQVPSLKLKWAFGFPGAAVVYSQPTMASGRIFVGLDTGYVYAIGAQTGCVYWSFAAKAGVRTAVSIGPIKKHANAKYAAYFGDIRGNVYAVNAETGDLLWTAIVETHPVTRITGAPTLYKGRLYVPVASMEEGAGGALSYGCCTFRGSVVALDANTGRQVWKAYTITGPLEPSRKNTQGTQLVGPSGGGVWDAPTVDPVHHAIYFGTGDAYSPPAAPTTDALMALDLNTGKILWSVQNTPNDVWIAACWPPSVSDNCPRPLGPDYDMSASPILVHLPNGRRALVAGQKSGIIYAQDPDSKGQLLWKIGLAPKPATDQGEVVWGGASDGRAVYFGLNSGGIVALNLADGTKKWFTPIDAVAGMEMHCGESGPLAAIPGIVFSDGWDGMVRALSTEDGRIVWQYDTNKGFETTDGVPAKGGSMGAAGPMVAGGMLFVPSGYVGVQNGMPGNVLLAFAPQ